MSTTTDRRSADGAAGAGPPRAEHLGSELVLPEYFERTCDHGPGRIAVEVGPARLTYAELDRRANRLAHLLRGLGVREGSRVGILLGRSEETYAAILGVLKAGAAYVPLDPSFPPDRLAYIVEDADVRDLVTTSTFRSVTADLPCSVLELDEVTADLAEQPAHRPDVGVAPSSL